MEIAIFSQMLVAVYQWIRSHIKEDLNIRVSATFWPEIAYNLSRGARILCQRMKRKASPLETRRNV
jgi:cystathionine beta-lyase/cystathionine gamma-synthase